MTRFACTSWYIQYSQYSQYSSSSTIIQFNSIVQRSFPSQPATDDLARTENGVGLYFVHPSEPIYSDDGCKCATSEQSKRRSRGETQCKCATSEQSSDAVQVSIAAVQVSRDQCKCAETQCK